MIYQNMKAFIIIASLLSLSGCSLFSPIDNGKTSTYVINQLPKKQSVGRHSSQTLLVLPPIIKPVYNTPLMAYTAKPYQIAFFSLNQWADTPPQMLQPLLVQAIQGKDYFKAVVVPPYAGRSDYLLATEILTLQQNTMVSPNVIELVVQAQLIRQATNRIVASRQFTITQPLGAQTPYGGVVATNQAAATLLRKIAAFCVSVA